MSKQIADFLIELSKNPLLAEQFKKDRLQAIAAAGFTGREADLLTISDVRIWGENFTEMRLQDGIGHRLAGQVTTEALACLRAAKRVFYLADPITESWLKQENPQGATLRDCYAPGKPRRTTYREMANRILQALPTDSPVCAAFY